MKYILLLLLGLIGGAAGAVFFLGVPSAKTVPGERLQPPAPGGDPPSTVVVSIADGFLNEVLGTVFRDLGPPSFNLSQSQGDSGSGEIKNAVFQGGCSNSVTLAPEASNIKTKVRFANGTISAPLAFSGKYKVLGNCVEFKGWAQTTIKFSFDQPNQTLYGRVNVEGVNLEQVAPFVNNFVTAFVRTAIDSRVNPIPFLRPQQLQLLIPVQASNGSVKAQVREVHEEIQDGSLRLHITYDFTGTKGQQPQV